MKISYKDITEKLGEPFWFTEHGYPRYCEFHPQECGIYHKEAALLLIRCQNCHKEFKVSETSNAENVLAEEIKQRRLFYGDPPDVGCCPAGPTMTSEEICVLEYWRKEFIFNKMIWRRIDELEIDLRHLLHEKTIEDYL